MHVLVLPSWYPTPEQPVFGVFVRDQAHALRAAGHRVSVLNARILSLRFWRKRPTGWRGGRSLTDDNGVITGWANHWLWTPRIAPGQAWLSVHHGLALFDAYRDRYGEPQVIHAHSALHGGLLAAAIKKRFAIPYVLTEHHPKYIRNGLNSSQIKRALLAYGQADQLLAPSLRFGQLLAQRYQTDWEVQHNLVHDRFFTTELPHRGTRANFTFICVAGLSEVKNPKLLLRAFARAFGDTDQVRLRFMGSGPDLADLQKMRGELGLESRVDFLGGMPPEFVPAQLAEADAYVMASNTETFCVALAEALAMGLPAVATRCGGPEEMIHEGNGLLVPTRDLAALAEAMRLLFRNRDRYDATLLRRDCGARFGAERFAADLSTRFERVTQLSRVGSK